MATTVQGTSRIITSDGEARLAHDVMTKLGGEAGFLVVEEPGGSHAIPREIGVLLQQVLMAVANGDTVTISSVPEELTTSAAASMLGISRPTLMKLVADGKLPAHRVGSHTRLNSSDVLVFKRERRERERASFRALLELEGDED